jgi:hypothetical protein
MPLAELKYSSDLRVNAVAILADIEQTVLRHDARSGDCKGRAYPTDQYHHSHLTLKISMLLKPHRDQTFTAALMQDQEQLVKARIQQSCGLSFALEYNRAAYVTNFHEVVS